MRSFRVFSTGTDPSTDDDEDDDDDDDDTAESKDEAEDEDDETFAKRGFLAADSPSIVGIYWDFDLPKVPGCFVPIGSVLS
jgi:hypothetical protein